MSILFRPQTRKLFFVGLLLFAAFFPPAPAAAGEFRVAAVQLEANPELFRSKEAFTAEVKGIMKQIAVNGGADLVVFPEYTGALLGVSEAVSAAGWEDHKKLNTSMMLTFLEGLYKDVPQPLRQFFLDYGKELSDSLDRIWMDSLRFLQSAQGRPAYILGGSTFVPVPAGGPATSGPEQREAENRELRNRAVLYGPGGKVYRQDKVYLTPFEREFLDLQSGPRQHVRPVKLSEGTTIAFTLCRDTFFDDWDRRFRSAGTDLWIDIKANGEVFDAGARKRFSRAIPRRLQKSRVRYGLTVSLNGELGPLFWEGPSLLHGLVPRSSAAAEKYRVEKLDSTGMSDDQSLLLTEFAVLESREEGSRQAELAYEKSLSVKIPSPVR
ncbi:MAG: hypothetical protein K9L68_05170 [Spirochaetales bacterium]|nr:hypothetical protein [Spirochaetales bacterium]MCF7937970.1 hypothetical protein [Spirochaetales bacterium]